MKLYKKTLAFAIFGLMALETSAFVNSDEPITFENLPQTAQTLIKDHFSHLTVARASYDADLSDNNYQVVLSDNTLIEFDKDGNWNNILCTGGSVPETLVPEAIMTYVKAHHADATVIEMEKENGNYEVLLSTKVELEFDSNFQLIETENEAAATEEAVEE